ncbi:MAG: hypothetical protein K9I94_12330 [Bacteroidales bacterium]|nr:hypothetical protein [Bacteroidales bacterium]
MEDLQLPDSIEYYFASSMKEFEEVFNQHKVDLVIADIKTKRIRSIMDSVRRSKSRLIVLGCQPGNRDLTMFSNGAIASWHEAIPEQRA